MFTKFSKQMRSFAPQVVAWLFVSLALPAAGAGGG